MFHHPKQCIISQAQPFFFSSSTFFFFWLKEALPGVFYNERRRGKRQLRVAKYISTEKKKKRKTYLNNLERSLLPLNFNNQPYTNGKRKKSNTIKEDRKTPSRINDREGENVNFCKTRALLGPEHRHQKGKWWFYIMLANIFCTNQLSSMQHFRLLHGGAERQVPKEESCF